MAGKRVTIPVMHHFITDISSMLAHAGFQAGLGGANVDFPGVEAFGLIDNETMLALVIEFTATCFIGSAVTFFGLKVF